MARAWWSSAVLLILGLGAGDLARGFAGLFARGFAGELAAGFAGLLAAGFLAARAGLFALGLAGLLAAGFLGGILALLLLQLSATEFHAVFFREWMLSCDRAFCNRAARWALLLCPV